MVVFPPNQDFDRRRHPMKEKPDYEKYPIREEEMGKRYKNWMEALARYVVMAYNVGKEVGGQKYVDRLRTEFFNLGQRGADFWMALSGTRKEDFADCRGLQKLQDCIDDTYANYWDGYIENTPTAFEKEVFTCPVVKPWSKAPELCEIMLAASMTGMMETLNPKFKAKGFSKLMTKGEKTCRFRVELKK
jgi:hypothetical protein